MGYSLKQTIMSPPHLFRLSISYMFLLLYHITNSCNPFFIACENKGYMDESHLFHFVR
jgi:hypothetical protein